MESSSIGGYTEYFLGECTGVSEVLFGEDASFRVDKRLLGEPVAQLAVRLLWGVLYGWFIYVDVYREALSSERGLSDDQPKLCLRHAVGDILFP